MTTIEAKRNRNTLVRSALSLARARRLDQPLKLGKKNEDSVTSGIFIWQGQAQGKVKFVPWVQTTTNLFGCGLRQPSTRPPARDAVFRDASRIIFFTNVPLCAPPGIGVTTPIFVLAYYRKKSSSPFQGDPGSLWGASVVDIFCFDHGTLQPDRIKPRDPWFFRFPTS